MREAEKKNRIKDSKENQEIFSILMEVVYRDIERRLCNTQKKSEDFWNIDVEVVVEVVEPMEGVHEVNEKDLSYIDEQGKEVQIGKTNRNGRKRYKNILGWVASM